MGYSDPKFYARELNLVAVAASFGTATANSATGANATAVAALPKFFRKTTVNKVRLRCTVIPNASSTALVASFVNGTNTFATVTLTTATVGQFLDGVVTASNATIAADAAPTINLTGTATASAAANGSYDVLFETQESFA